MPGTNIVENEELIAITKELADTLRKNRTIDWQKRDSARAKMRMLIKRLLKHHKYPPEGMDDAVQIVMTQCELWADNNDMGERVNAWLIELDDPEIRSIIRWHYLNGKSWKQTSRLVYGANSYYNARKTLMRWFGKEK